MSYERHIFCTECGAKAPWLHDHGNLSTYQCTACPATLTYDGDNAVYHLDEECWACQEGMEVDNEGLENQ